MNGAQALIRTLVEAGVDVCFANPGTSEMHFVAALDDVPAMRAVLTLFEGVATGAADGYGRMAGRPAATLLHLGPGLANGIANLHNARRARTPLVNIVGDHAMHHKRLDAPLESDIDALASAVSGWFRRSLTTSDLAADAADAVAAARSAPGLVATLVLPADVSWGEGAGPAAPQRHRAPAPVRPAVVREVAKALTGQGPSVLFLGGNALTERGLLAAARVAAATEVRLLCETFPARLPRGAGLPFVRPLAYPHVLGAGTEPPQPPLHRARWASQRCRDPLVARPGGFKPATPPRSPTPRRRGGRTTPCSTARGSSRNPYSSPGGPVVPSRTPTRTPAPGSASLGDKVTQHCGDRRVDRSW